MPTRNGSLRYSHELASAPPLRRRFVPVAQVIYRANRVFFSSFFHAILPRVLRRVDDLEAKPSGLDVEEFTMSSG